MFVLSCFIMCRFVWITTVKTQKSSISRILPLSFYIHSNLLTSAPPWPLKTTNLVSISMMLSFPKCCINGTIPHETYWDCLFSLSVFLLKSFKCVSVVPLLYCWLIFHGIDVWQFIFSHLLTKKHLSCFRFGDITNKTDISNSIQVFTWA